MATETNEVKTKNVHLKRVVEVKCLCGRDLEEEVKGIVTKYKDKRIIINDVPYFICHFGHIKMARTTRKSIKALLEKAYEEGKTEINFTA